MGQKVNAKAFRMPLRKNWSSKWIATDNKKYKELLLKDLKIRELIKGRLKAAGAANIEIERSANEVTINIYVARPGMVIGRGGSGIEELKRILEGQFGEKIKLNVLEIKSPDLEANLVAQGVADQIERRMPVKRIIALSLDRVMRSGAKGCKIRVSGRISGGEIARIEQGTNGSIPLGTLKADIDFAVAEAKTATAGVLGVKVWINRP